jgi:hypothetical protein
MIALLLAAVLAQEDGFQLNTGPVRFRSVELRAGILSASDLDMNVGDALEVVSNGLNPDFSSRLRFEETTRLDASTLGVSFDFNLFSLAVEGFFGDWEGEGILSYGQDGGPRTTQKVDLEGDAWGAHFTFEWPALRYETPAFAASLGPVLGVNWFHEEVDDVPESPLPFDEQVNALVGSFGPRLTLAVRFDRLELSLQGEVDFLFGQLSGLETRAALGIGLRF